MLPLVILFEFGGGLAILFGFLTRTTALFTAGFTLLTAFLFHSLSLIHILPAFWVQPSDLSSSVVIPPALFPGDGFS